MANLKNNTTNNGKKGGLLKGKRHYDKGGKPLGGIKAIVSDTGQMVELEGGEVIINREASKKHWKELSKINQSAGNGVPILPPDVVEGDTEEYKNGGRTIEFNPNHLPNKWIYEYAKKIKEKYPKVWDLGGNQFGNEAYKNLERALKRGYWTENEEWFYVKWQSFNARHSGDFRIAGVIANLKWLNKVDKGWDYMKNLIEEAIEKKYGEKPKTLKRGGKLIKRADGSYSKRGLWDNIRDNEGSGKKPTKKMLEQAEKIKKEDGGSIHEQGAHKSKIAELTRLTMKPFAYREKVQFIKENPEILAGKFFKGGGELKKGIKTEKEHSDTLKSIYEHKVSLSKAPELIAKDHLKEDKRYYTKLNEMEQKFATGGTLEEFGLENLQPGDKGTFKKDAIIVKRIDTNQGRIYYTDASGKTEFYRSYDRFALFFKDEDGNKLKPGAKGKKKAPTAPPTPTTAPPTTPPIAPPQKSAKQSDDFKGVVFKIDTPTGEPSKLTYLQQMLVRTSAFKKFFGDWENAAQEAVKDPYNFSKKYDGVSAVIDLVTLEPRLVYHGTMTDKEFFEFEVNRNDVGRPYSYFAKNKEYAENFTESSQRGTGTNTFLYECFLSIKKPFDASDINYEDKKANADYWLTVIADTIHYDKYGISRDDEGSRIKEIDTIVKEQIGKYAKSVFSAKDNYFWALMAADKKSVFKYFLISHGYDGVIYTENISNNFDIKNPKEFTVAYTIFDDIQVKLGDGRNIDFDPMKKDIRLEDGGNVAKTNEGAISKKDELGKMLFGDKYENGGGLPENHSEHIKNEELHKAEPKNESRQFVDDLISKMNQ